MPLLCPGKPWAFHHSSAFVSRSRCTECRGPSVCSARLMVVVHRKGRGAMASRRAFPTQVMSCVLALALLAGCSQPSPQAPLVTPSATPNSATSRTDAPVTPSASPSAATSARDVDRTTAYSRIKRELTDFLDAWRTKGYAEASKAYLVPGEQASPSDVVPVLASGRVVAVRPDQWTSPDLFVV